MSAPPYQKWFWGSYHKHTAHLRDARDHGAYILLIGALWNAGGRLSADDETLAAYAKLSVKDWQAVKPRLLPMFKLVRGKLTHPRVTEDLAEYADTIRQRKLAGKSGGEARARKVRENRIAGARSLLAQSESDSKSSTPDPLKGGLRLKAWRGSPDILRALSREHRDGEVWALTYLAYCREQQVPYRALITSVGWVHDGLNRDAAGALRDLGVRVLLETAA